MSSGPPGPIPATIIFFILAAKLQKIINFAAKYKKKMRRIILITGGQRSGKSQHAEQLALQLAENPVYLATAHVWDEEFRQRVLRHQERRGPQWTNIE
jgi:adenosylcobinamide kinase/adenosylcobinamide-phosphate guanylyltransferase